MLEEYDVKKELYEQLLAGSALKDARDFVFMYCDYVHAVDDCIDEEKSTEQVAKTIKLAALVFNSAYWNKWKHALFILERVIYCNYFDSVIWEQKDQEEWKKRDAKVLNQSGYLMIFAVILIELGEDKLKEVSLRMREYMHKTQGHDKLN